MTNFDFVDGPLLVRLSTNPYKLADDESAAAWIAPRTYRVTCIDDDPECYIFQGRESAQACVGFIGYTQAEHFDRFDCRPHEGDVIELTTEGARLIGVRLINRAGQEQEHAR